MTMSIIFKRRTPNRILASSDPAKVWDDWRGKDECWLFAAAHDDDVVCGAGLTFLAGLRNGVRTHAVIASNGRMGYCTPEQRSTIAKVRVEETRQSFERLGLPRENLHQFNYDDGSLFQETGRRFASESNDNRNAIEGGCGLQNSLTWVLRKVRPTRVFLPNRTDLHPDHRAVHQDLIISIFHAQGEIWPELGLPIAEIPKLYEYATYSDFVTPPTMQVRVPEELVKLRLEAVALYRSQLQIELLVESLRKAGNGEYLLEMQFDLLQPGKYDSLFDAVT